MTAAILLVASLTSAFAAGGESTVPEVPPLGIAAPQAPLNASATAMDPQAALVEKLAGRLPGLDCVTRQKTVSWIGELALEHPREAVQIAAAQGLLRDSIEGRNLVDFEHVADTVASFAAGTDHEAVFEETVNRLIEIARRSGRARREAALQTVERVALSGDAARRARAAELLGALRADPSSRLDQDALDRRIARLK